MAGRTKSVRLAFPYKLDGDGFLAGISRLSGFSVNFRGKFDV